MTKYVVRCTNRMVFEIDEKTLEPKHASVYDAYCFIDPEPNTIYLDHSDWCKRCTALDKAKI